ncbi:u6 snRNA phosphodiesterase [Trichonephila inaurata madagascariensis]|uniref:U6 snRNA phosphodiesterase n=1 Tax=Trichonephila inaurata madagascariensis TaxID=2747483 RepID=A0A8X6WU87_9ARAC|nr:u6 snRNA phosphodiesterase [Trichonephila inaurata madagascariensis]
MTLPRLVDYSSDDSLSDENEEPVKSGQNEATKSDYSSPNFTQKEDALPLPFEIKQMYKETPCEIVDDDPSKHGGKIRSFPHERGVWATYVYIEYDPEPEFYNMIEELKKRASDHGIDLQVPKDFHVSLTKTLKLRHHWISPFIDALRNKLSCHFQFKVFFDSLEVYENEEKTRTFVGLKIRSDVHLLTLLEKVDSCVKEFKLPIFYEDPSFHPPLCIIFGKRV